MIGIFNNDYPRIWREHISRKKENANAFMAFSRECKLAQDNLCSKDVVKKVACALLCKPFSHVFYFLFMDTKVQLRKKPDFTTIYSKGKRHYFSGVLLFFMPNATSRTRIACVVGKKHSLRAVKRNKQRRILSHATQKYGHYLLPGFDIVISYTNHGNVLPYKEACVIIAKLLSQANLLTK